MLITVQASAEGDEVRVRIVAAEALEAAACRIGKGLRIHLRDEAPLGLARQDRCDRRGDGEVSVLVPSDGGAQRGRGPAARPVRDLARGGGLAAVLGRDRIGGERLSCASSQAKTS